MRILIFNWSDIKNPDSGGAEVLTHEIAKRWVAGGHQVTQFCSEFPDAKKKEIIDGVAIIREGSPIVRDPHIPVHLAAYRWYQHHGKGAFDVVIDEIHGIPFFTPLYVKEKKIALICEVANELWDVTFPFPFNSIGKTIERHYFRFYTGVPFLTISASTRDDLIQKRVPKDHITVLPMGLTVPTPLAHFTKENTPTLIFVGRLAKTKGVDVLFNVLEAIKHKFPTVKLWIVGRGDNKKRFDTHVTYFGFVSERKKFELMARAHIILVPSFKEGWGLIVPEAGIMNTPAVAYNVAGLQDVIQHEKSGLLVLPHSEAMADGVLRLLTDKKLYASLQKQSQKIARGYSWDNTASVALDILKQL